MERILGLNHSDKNMQMLCDNIPGGIFKCLFDEELTLLEMSAGFLSMTGYSYEEVEHDLHNSLRSLIQPDDLAEALKTVREQLRHGNTKEIQYRLIHKDGHYINVIDKGTLLLDEQGRQAFYCIVIDITREKKIEEELRLSLERYQIIINQTNDVVFEWDFRNNTFLTSNTWEKKFGKNLPMSAKGVDNIFIHPENSPINPNDFDEVKSCIRDIQARIPYIEKKLRLKDASGRYIWCKMRLTQQFAPDGTPLKVIGALSDIDREFQKSQTLKRKAEQDALTGMYNKITSHSLIRSYLQDKPDEVSALMIIDIDNFKSINDTLGHLYGDAVLTELSRVMRRSFRDADILGRVGGDEFIVFLKGISSVDNARLNAEKVLRLFSELRSKGKIDTFISCSIGVALYPIDGEDFTTLYRSADHALYQAKKEGKNRYAIYGSQSLKHLYPKNYPQACSETEIDTPAGTTSEKAEILEYIFHVLYNTKDLKHGISAILEMVGRHFDVSRVYIFENSDNSLYCRNTFEWCNEGVESQLDALQTVSYEDDLGGNFLANFNEDNIFYCSDITKLPKLQYELLNKQNIKSLLQCAITDDGEMRGFVGFDECRQNRLWTKGQIDVLTLISEILSTFLLKRRASERYRRENEGLMSVLDNQNAWIYVIDPETMEIRFLNKKSRTSSSDAYTGRHCYEVFMNRSEPCTHCPAAHLTNKCTSHTVDLFNPRLKIWFSAEATTISWKGQRSILLTCHDISRYKI